MSKKEGEPKNEPFYHESENFITAYFGKVPESVLKDTGTKTDHKLISSLVAQLCDPNQRENRTIVLNMLREAQAQPLFVSIIGMKEYDRHRAQMITAAWESGMDFSAYLPFFVAQAIDDDFTICMESCTVITENMDGPLDPADVKDAIDRLSKAPSANKELVAPAIEKLQHINQ